MDMLVMFRPRVSLFLRKDCGGSKAATPTLAHWRVPLQLGSAIAMPNRLKPLGGASGCDLTAGWGGPNASLRTRMSRLRSGRPTEARGPHLLGRRENILCLCLPRETGKSVKRAWQRSAHEHGISLILVPRHAVSAAVRTRKLAGCSPTPNAR